MVRYKTKFVKQSNLAKIMKKRNVSPSLLANLMKVKITVVRGWMYRNNPELKHACKIMAILNCSIYDLIHERVKVDKDGVPLDKTYKKLEEDKDEWEIDDFEDLL